MDFIVFIVLNKVTYLHNNGFHCFFHCHVLCLLQILTSVPAGAITAHRNVETGRAHGNVFVMMASWWKPRSATWPTAKLWVSNIQMWYPCWFANMIVYPDWALSPEGVWSQLGWDFTFFSKLRHSLFSLSLFSTLTLFHCWRWHSAQALSHFATRGDLESITSSTIKGIMKRHLDNGC